MGWWVHGYMALRFGGFVDTETSVPSIEASVKGRFLAESSTVGVYMVLWFGVSMAN